MCVCVCVWGGTCMPAPRWRLEDILQYSVPSFHHVISLGLNSGYQTWQQELLSMEPSHWLPTLFFETDPLTEFGANRFN